MNLDGIEFGSRLVQEAPRDRRGFWQLRPLDLLASPALLRVDVRSDEDYLLRQGHIPGVLHWPASRCFAGVLPQAQGYPGIVLICGDGRESAECAAWVAKTAAFGETFHLVGGMLRWMAERRPSMQVRTYHRRCASLPQVSAVPSLG